MTTRWLVLAGLGLLRATALADAIAAMTCPQLLEQITTLRTMSPVYQLTGTDQRHYLEDKKRPAELSRLQRLAAAACSQDSQSLKAQQAEAERLHVALSPECAVARDELAAMQTSRSRVPADSIGRKQRVVAANCPVVDSKDRWLLQWDGRSTLLEPPD